MPCTHPYGPGGSTRSLQLVQQNTKYIQNTYGLQETASSVNEFAVTSAHHICKACFEEYNGAIAFQVLLRLFLQGFKGHYVQYFLTCGGEPGDEATFNVCNIQYYTNIIVAMSMQHCNYCYNQFTLRLYYFSGCR